MFDNINANIEYCQNIVESVRNILFYSHIPTALLFIFISIFIYVKNRKNILAQILLLISFCFSMWSGLDLLIWLNYNYSPLLMFAWSNIESISVLLFIMAYYFCYVFINDRDMDLKKKVTITILYLPVILFSSTSLNIMGYDAQECIAIENPIFANYVLILKSILTLSIIILFLRSTHKLDSQKKKKAAILAIGMLSFIFAFLLSGIIAGYTENYLLEIYGLAAMIIFIITLGKLVLIYKEFNLKIFSSQLFVIALIALIAAQFSFIQNPINKFLNSITLIGSLFFGIQLIRSVKREVEQRERIEKLAKDLEVANEKLRGLDQLKTEFLSLATHQIRSPLTAIKGYSSMLLEGDFGALPVRARESVKTIFASCQHLINIVEDFLNISRIEQGRMTYNKGKFDLKILADEAIKELSPNIEKKDLKIEFRSIDTAPITVDGDRNKIKQVLHDVIDNAIKYTKAGQIEVQVLHDRENAEVVIKDTGVGMDTKDMERLFAKFSRASDAYKHDVSGTGLGLYIAQKMIEAHNGKIMAQSLGRGKGSTFTIVLPLARS